MYILNWLHVIGSHLLILAHITNSLVLLTANVEDIKRIAQKFISESLADKLTDLIVKATDKSNIDVSEENKQTEKIYDVPKDNWRDNHKNRGVKDRRRPIKPEKVRNYETTQHEVYKDRGNVIGSGEIKKTRYNLKSSRDTGTKEYINQNPYIENVNLKAIREPTILSDKRNTFESINRDEHDDYMNSINEIRNRVFTASTKKERNEFDQYDNSYYPKAGIIATSGGVALTKGPDDSGSSVDNKD